MQDGFTAHDVAVMNNNMVQAQILHHFIIKESVMKMEDRLLSRLFHSIGSSSNIHNHNNKRKYDCIIDDEKQDVL